MARNLDFVTISHPDFAETAEVPESTVANWQARGWTAHNRDGKEITAKKADVKAVADQIAEQATVDPVAEQIAQHLAGDVPPDTSTSTSKKVS